AAPSGRFLLFHVNFGVPEEYEENHIPGALYLDTNRLENPRDWNRRTAEELEVALRSFGITRDTTVILYGRDTEGHANEKWPGRRAGQIAACRAALILRYAGVDDVRLLDGGYDHWVQAGNPLETVLNKPEPVASFGVPIPLRRQHDGGLSGDRGELERRGNHRRQVGRLLLRHRLAGRRDLVLRVPDGLAPYRRLRRRLVRVE